MTEISSSTHAEIVSNYFTGESSVSHHVKTLDC